MNLYEIDQAILNCVDAETGEIIDADALNALEMERDAKIENVALWIKNLLSNADQMKAERDALAKRERSARNKAESLKRYLSAHLNGKGFDSPRVAARFRESEAVEVSDVGEIAKMDDADQYLKYADPEPNKAAIKRALKNGVKVPGCSLAKRRYIQIK